MIDFEIQIHNSLKWKIVIVSAKLLYVYGFLHKFDKKKGLLPHSLRTYVMQNQRWGLHKGVHAFEINHYILSII